ncbi:MAG: hypothetical protein Q7T16_05060 [Candidatus Burarchaeum sp.]|nr:hypothetical protein [Candidatus Burarchaeum sp.]MDO8339999.1 hypothetical protein [Candidatus Burarchaeum sp.]
MRASASPHADSKPEPTILESRINELRQCIEDVTYELGQVVFFNTRVLGENTELEMDIDTLSTFGFSVKALLGRVNQLNRSTAACITCLERVQAAVTTFKTSGQADQFVKLNPAYGVQTNDFNQLTSGLEKDARELAASLTSLAFALKILHHLLKGLPSDSVSDYFASNPNAHDSFILATMQIADLTDLAILKPGLVAINISKLLRTLKNWSLKDELNAILTEKTAASFAKTVVYGVPPASYKKRLKL